MNSVTFGPLIAAPGTPRPWSSPAPAPLWYTTRATGLVAMVLLTISMAFGLLSSVGYQRPGLPRFVTVGLHRNASLLALAFTAAHVITTVVDSFVHIPVQDAFIPFISSYRPLWLGLGTVASDLILALTVTSLLRSRMGYRTWRAVHWTAYACWPVALLHGLGTGTDTPVQLGPAADPGLRRRGGRAGRLAAGGRLARARRVPGGRGGRLAHRPGRGRGLADRRPAAARLGPALGHARPRCCTTPPGRCARPGARR